MAVKKQPDSDPGHIQEATDLWFRQFLKHLELSLLATGQKLAADAEPADYGLFAVQAVKTTLIESGLDEQQVIGLLGQAALQQAAQTPDLEWNEDLNRRRFHLIDGDIQGCLSREERLELAGLTQLMRATADSEVNLPLDGARKLHQRLLDSDKLQDERA